MSDNDVSISYNTTTDNTGCINTIGWYYDPNVPATHDVEFNDLIQRFPRHPFPGSIMEDLDQIFNSFFKNLPSPLVVEDSKFPKCNAWTDENGLHIHLAMPYATKDDVSIDVDTKLRKLTVSAKAHQDDTIKKEAYFKREIARSSFKRTFVLGAEFDIDSVDASLEDGLLKIDISPSEDEKDRHKKVDVR